MAHQVLWTKYIIDTFSDLAMLSDEEKIVLRTRAAGMTIVQQSQLLNMSTAKVLAQISEDESGHVKRLHDAVSVIINRYRSEHGDPPDTMKAVYDYLHKKQIATAERVKNLQNTFREN